MITNCIVSIGGKPSGEKAVDDSNPEDNWDSNISDNWKEQIDLAQAEMDEVSLLTFSQLINPE